jgi:hypothetical protein
MKVVNCVVCVQMNCGRIGHRNTRPMNITEVGIIDYLMELLI